MFKKNANSKATVDRSNIYTTGQIGRTRETTPEGYLLCRDVRLARTGELLYGEGEVPVTADSTGLIRIERDASVLFDPRTISSAEGKSVTDDHPDKWVNSRNWKDLTNGAGHNIYQGKGEDSDYLMGDLLITDQKTIEKVLAGKVEISLGYDADYTEISAGRGKQSNILVNHIALVDNGRCGSRCSIGDNSMADKAKKTPWYQKMLGAKKTMDEALEEAKKETEDSGDETEDEEESSTKTSDAKFQKQMLSFMKTMDSRLTKLENRKTKDSEESEKETEDDDEEAETKDDGDLTEPEKGGKLEESGTTTYTGDSLKEVISRAEILAPGYRVPTFDSANNGKAVLNTKRSVLKQAIATEDGAKAITPFVGSNPDFDKLPQATIDAAFAGASELIRQTNNLKGVRTGITTKDFGRQAPTVDQINQRNKDFWKGNK